MRTITVLIVAILSMACGLAYMKEIHPYTFCPTGVLALFLFLNWLTADNRNPAYQQLKRMPSNTMVIPIVSYKGMHDTSNVAGYPEFVYEHTEPAISAKDLLAQLPRASIKHLQATPITNPKEFAREVKQAQTRAAKQTRRNYGVPEYAVDGTITGYKWLMRDADGELYSPMRRTKWEGGHLKSDRVPDDYNQNGINYGYSPDSDALKPYSGSDVLAAIQFQGDYIHSDESGRADEGDISQIIIEKPVPDTWKPLKFFTEWKNREKDDE